jgi:threonine/homoserine/homoserine lactone efflux protein
MPAVHDLWLFVAAGLLLNLTPGPDMAYIAARSAAGGFRAGAAATLGITAGCVVHTIAAATGLSLLLATSATAFSIVKWLGAAYLAYAGVRLLLASVRQRSDSGTSVHAPAPARSGVIFREALVINVFNPKVALFFLAFLPQFIDASAAWPALSFLFLGTLFNVNSLFVNLPVAWLAARAARRGRASPRVERALHGAAGALFIFLAVRLAALQRT